MSGERRALPIGVFDSGLGGLTVVHQLRQQLPEESIVYLGDTARVPYGTRSPATVVRYARGCARLLADRGIKALVVACNTASAVSLDILQAELDVPVIGVVEPGVRAALRAADALSTQTGRAVRIGILGTPGTVQSAAYPSQVARLSSTVEVVQQAAPLLVPLVEEGWIAGEVPELAVRRYVGELVGQGARVVVLGCTHYPLLKPLIERCASELAGEAVSVVDGASATAEAVRDLLLDRGLLTPHRTERGTNATLQLLVSDLPRAFQLTAGRFLGASVPEPQQVDVMPAS